MILSYDNYDLLLLADWLEEYGTSYDIVKSTAIRNFKYNLNFKDNCYDIYHGDDVSFGYGNGCGDNRGTGRGYGSGSGYGWGFGSGYGNAIR